MAHYQKVSLFYRYFFGRSSCDLAQLVPLPYPQRRSTLYSDRLHDFSVTIPNDTRQIIIIVKRNRKTVWKHGHLNRNLYVMLKFTERSKTPGTTSKNKCLSLKGISWLQVIFMLIWIKQILIWFNLQRDGTGNRLSNIKDTFAEGLQLQISVLHQSMCWSLKFMMAGQNIKKKYLMCQISIKMLKQHGIPNSSLYNLKIYSSRGCRKIVQRLIICMCLANTAILNIQIFSRRYHLRLWVFASTG